MTSSSNPPIDTGLTDETARDLTRQVARLARAIEKHNERAGDSYPSRPLRIEAPAIHYPADTIDPPRMPRNLSWHERVREKKVSLSSATGWSLLGYVAIEVIQAFIAGRLHLW